VLMLLPIYGLVWPVPVYPDNLVPWITLAWLAAGAGYLWSIHRRRPDLLVAMGRVFGDQTDDAVGEAASLHGAAPGQA